MRVNDYELLSAYIDGELTEAERAALEARLQAEPRLQRELQSLQQTTSLIRQMPELKAPRDFTLDIAVKRPARVLPFTLTATFSALSTAAAVLLVAFGGYFLLQADSMSLSGDFRSRQTMQTGASLTIAPSEIALAPTGTPAPTQMVLVPTASAEIAAMEAPVAQSAPAEGDGAAAGMLAEESGQDAADSDTTLSGADDAAADETFAQMESETADPLAFPAPTTRDEPEFYGRGPMATIAAPGMAFSTMPATAEREQTAVGEAELQDAPPAAPPTSVALENQQNTAATDLNDLDLEAPEQAAQEPVVTQPETAEQVEPASDNRALIGLVLAGAGVIMLAVAVITTLLRRRSLNRWA